MWVCAAPVGTAFDPFCSKNGNTFFFSFGLRLGMLFLKGNLRAGMENKVFGSETVPGFKEPGVTPHPSKILRSTPGYYADVLLSLKQRRFHFNDKQHKSTAQT